MIINLKSRSVRARNQVNPPSAIYPDVDYRRLWESLQLENGLVIKKRSKKAGSSLCRIALWQWLFTRIEPPKQRLKTDIGKLLGARLDEEKQHKPVKLARSRVCAYAVDLLFRELVQELCRPD